MGIKIRGKELISLNQKETKLKKSHDNSNSYRKTSDKTQYLFMIKTLSKLQREEFPQLEKDFLQKAHS